MDVVLLYTESGLSYSRTFSLLAIKGMDNPDRLHKIGVQHDCLDGSVSEQILGFRKEITLTFKPPIFPDETRFLTGWFNAETKLVVYGVYISEGITDDTLVSTWLNDCEYGRTFDVAFFDSHVYHAWSDGTIADTDMYYTAIVEITGTLASPQTFTTNVAPLATDIWGNSFPAFSGTVHKASILAISAAYSQFVYCQIGEVTVSGGNLTWQGFASDFGTPADDGKYYVKFTISVQTTT